MRLSRLVGDVLDLAKLEADRFALREEEVDLGRLLEQAQLAFSEQARRHGIDFDCELEGAPILMTDGDRVLQVVSNLIGNALQWTPDAGHVRLSMTDGDDAVVISVEDSGPGIPAELRENVFRPFFSENGGQGGTGLGLATVPQRWQRCFTLAPTSFAASATASAVVLAAARK